mmetsp:Transcript_111989/g.317440  ORF Transcript_111989/g.317440 Transcript_111989/m.317440 type:complete len:401 (-) Transcript_111989:845-2047(-)
MHQVRAASEPRGLDRGGTAKAEVVELQVNVAAADGVAGARLVEVARDRLLRFAANCADSGRVPHLHQERLEVASEPEALVVGVLDREHDVLPRQHGALGHCLDQDGQMPPVLFQDVLPPRLVEQTGVVAPPCLAEVRLESQLCSVYPVAGDHRPSKVPLDVVLQAEEHDLFVRPSHALEVRVDGLTSWRVLQVPRHLVGVGEHQNVVVDVPPSDGDRGRGHRRRRGRGPVGDRRALAALGLGELLAQPGLALVGFLQELLQAFHLLAGLLKRLDQVLDVQLLAIFAHDHHLLLLVWHDELTHGGGDAGSAARHAHLPHHPSPLLLLQRVRRQRRALEGPLLDFLLEGGALAALDGRLRPLFRRRGGGSLEGRLGRRFRRRLDLIGRLGLDRWLRRNWLGC